MAVDTIARALAIKAQQGGGSGGTSNYQELTNKPSINGVVLEGNKTSSDLGIETGVTEEQLTQALAQESSARQKQDSLLEEEIAGKIAPSNIKAGDGINLEQSGLDVIIQTIGLQTYLLKDNSQENPLKLWEVPTGNYYLYYSLYSGVEKALPAAMYIQVSPDKSVDHVNTNMVSPFVYYNKIKDDGTTEGGTNDFAIVELNSLTTTSKEILEYVYFLSSTVTGFNSSYSKSQMLPNGSTSSATVTSHLTFNRLPDTSVAPTEDTNFVNKAYVDGLVSTISTLSFQVVTELPTTDIQTNIIYLVPSTTSSGQNIYDEYIYINSTWEKIGSTSVNLSNYLAKDNTTAYTPTGDYNPATKQYVDSSVTNQATTEETISGLKTFTTLPESSVVPTADNQLVNKAYVDQLFAQYQQSLVQQLSALTTPPDITGELSALTDIEGGN